jgi:nucleotide-binding universal stress UspA family protein
VLEQLQGDHVFTNVLVGVDGRPSGRDAIALAKQLAEPEPRLTLTHVYGGAWMIGRAAAMILSAGAEYSEQMLVREAAAASLQADLVCWPSRSVGRGLHELAELRETDLLVVGSRRRGRLETVLTGDHTIASLNGASCAVAIAPSGYAEYERRLDKLGVGHDGSAESEQALRAARELAAHHGSAISVLSVVSLQSIPNGDATPPANWTGVTARLIEEERRRLQSLDGVNGDAVYGEPGDELLRFAEDLDLLIVGSRGYGPVGRLFNGSTSTFLARHAPCPLLVLPRRAARA